MDQENLEDLLDCQIERFLDLLHTYTSLRDDMNAQLSAVGVLEAVASVSLSNRHRVIYI